MIQPRPTRTWSLGNAFPSTRILRRFPSGRKKVTKRLWRFDVSVLVHATSEGEAAPTSSASGATTWASMSFHDRP